MFIVALLIFGQGRALPHSLHATANSSDTLSPQSEVVTSDRQLPKLPAILGAVDIAAIRFNMLGSVISEAVRNKNKTASRMTIDEEPSDEKDLHIEMIQLKDDWTLNQRLL